MCQLHLFVLSMAALLCQLPTCTQELYSHYTQQVKDTCASLADPHKAYLLRKAMHYFNTQRQHREEAHDKPLIEVRHLVPGHSMFPVSRCGTSRL